MSALPARLGDRYEVGDLIGRGGMADVHRAHDTVLDRDVAVKLLRDVSSVDARRFDDEARLLSTLDHPNIVALIDAGVTDDRPWIALELIEGSTLGQLMASGPLDEQTVTRIGRDVADALAHAHAFGVVHRDVKPSNIVLAADGSAKLADFGIARLEDATSGVTLTGHTVGTAAYLSPEQVRGEQITGAGDVYALGLVLLEALSGTRTYPGPPIEAAMARLHRSPLIPTSLPPGWPGLLASMTASTASSRPTAADVAHRLSPEGSITGVFDDDATTTSGVAIVAAPRRRLGFLLAALAIVLATSLVLARGLSGDAPDTAEAADATPTAAPSTTSPSAKASQSAVLDSPTSSPSSVATQQASSAGTTGAGTSKGPKTNKPGKSQRQGKKAKGKKAKHAGKKHGATKKPSKAKKPPKSKGKSKGKKK